MTWAQVKELASAGMEIGSHTKSHVLLSACSEEKIKEEVVGSKEDIVKNASVKVTAISYPSGSYSRQASRIVKGSGYTSAFCSEFGYARNGMDYFSIRRIAVGNSVLSVSRILEPSAGFLMAAFCKEKVTKIAKTVLGRSLYDSLYFKVFRLKTPVEV